jgi:phage FluMu protein Com
MKSSLTDLRCPHCNRLQLRYEPSEVLYLELRCLRCKLDFLVEGFTIVTLADGSVQQLSH